MLRAWRQLGLVSDNLVVRFHAGGLICGVVGRKIELFSTYPGVAMSCTCRCGRLVYSLADISLIATRNSHLERDLDLEAVVLS